LGDVQVFLSEALRLRGGLAEIADITDEVDADPAIKKPPLTVTALEAVLVSAAGGGL
jgi:hypothetical protein